MRPWPRTTILFLRTPRSFFEILKVPALPWVEEVLYPLSEREVEKQLVFIFCFLQRLGVWEVMPLVALMNHSGKGIKDPWAEKPFRKEHWRIINEVDCDFNRYKGGHKNIHVEEDYDWLWPFKNPDSFLRSLSRAPLFYDQFSNIILGCYGCVRHKTLYKNSKEFFQPSFIFWRLLYEQWLPCLIDGDGEEICRPIDAWWETGNHEISHMRTSPLRFLPIPKNLTPETATLCRLKTLDRAGVKELEKLLTRLRADYGFGDLFIRVSKDSSFRQAFIGLHRRLYSKLRDRGDNKKKEVLDSIQRIGVLCDNAGTFIWKKPEEAWYDDGKFSTYKGRFVRDVSFSILSRSDEDNAIAKFLGIPTFTLKVARTDSFPAKEVTHDFPIINKRITELFALLVFYKIGRLSLKFESEDFSVRLNRVKKLRVFQVEDLRLEVKLEGTSYMKKLGEGRNKDLYLDKTNPRSPKVYHDFSGPNWVDDLQGKIAPFIADLINNMAYADVIALFLQCSDANLGQFLNERGITDLELDLIRGAIGEEDIILRKNTQKWWVALFRLFEIPHESLGEKEVSVRVKKILQGSKLNSNFINKILAYRDVAYLRADSEGILKDIEAEGYSLEKLDKYLREGNGEGLTIKGGLKLLKGWRDTHEKELAYTMWKLGIAPKAAKKIANSWPLPSNLIFKISLALGDILKPFVDFLNSQIPVSKNKFSTHQLTHTTLAHCAELCKESKDQIAINCKKFYSEEEQAEIRARLFSELKKRLCLFITAKKIFPGANSWEISGIHREVEAVFLDCSEEKTLITQMGNFGQKEYPLLVNYFTKILGADILLSLPSLDEMYEELSEEVGETEVKRIQKVLAKTSRKKIDELINRIGSLKKASIKLKPYEGTAPKSSKRRSVELRKKVEPHHVKPRNQRYLKKLGEEGEEWVLAAMIDRLEGILKESSDVFCSVLEKLSDALKIYYKGTSVEKLISFKKQALLNIDEPEERLDALLNFIHLSKESDSFGCDILGWMAPFPGEGDRPVFLEVKSDSDRSFNVSRAEWARAEVLQDSYAFLVVLRDHEKNTPKSFEILPNPYQLAEDTKIEKDEDGWIVSYKRAVV